MRRKHCGKRRNCSLRANFSFSHSVFKRLVLQTHKNQGLFGKGINSLHAKKALVVKCLLKTHWETGEIARNEQSLLFPQCFLPFWRTLPFSSNLKLLSTNSFSFEVKNLFFGKVLRVILPPYSVSCFRIWISFRDD